MNSLPQTQFLGVIVSSDRASEVMNWYRAVFDGAEEARGNLLFGGVKFFVEPHSEISGPTREPGRMILNFVVADCRATAAAMRQAGTTWIRPPEEVKAGVIATATDPDGNLVQIIEFADRGTAN